MVFYSWNSLANLFTNNRDIIFERTCELQGHLLERNISSQDMLFLPIESSFASTCSPRTEAIVCDLKRKGAKLLLMVVFHHL